VHPLSTYEVHRQDQADVLRRSTQQHVHEHGTRPRDDTHGRPPDPAPARRRATRARAVRPQWTATS